MSEEAVYFLLSPWVAPVTELSTQSHIQVDN